jgi:hypothetical protein
MSTQAPCNVPEDDVAVIELDRKGRARENLLNIADYLKRGFLDILRRRGFGYARTGFGVSIAKSDG